VAVRRDVPLLSRSKIRASDSIAPRASQRFDIVAGRVEPQILTTEDDRLAFPVAFPWRSRLEVRAVPVSRATVEIAVVERGHRLTLSRRSLAEPRTSRWACLP